MNDYSNHFIIGLVINIIINALQIGNVVGCSFSLVAAVLSSQTNWIIRRTEKDHSKRDNSRPEIELNEIKIEQTLIPNTLIPKAHHSLNRSLPTRATTK